MIAKLFGGVIASKFILRKHYHVVRRPCVQTHTHTHTRARARARAHILYSCREYFTCANRIMKEKKIERVILNYEIK